MPSKYNYNETGYINIYTGAHLKSRIPEIRNDMRELAWQATLKAAVKMHRAAVAGASKPGLRTWDATQHPARRSGNLVGSIKLEQVDSTVVNTNYQVYVDEAKAPYGQSLEDGTWVEGLFGRRMSPKSKKLGIRKTGNFPYPFFRPAYNETVPFFLQEMKEEVVRRSVFGGLK